ncbi:MAG: response regulator [Rhodopila sp.]|nr:response regulator [Rhodopila sp.]
MKVLLAEDDVMLADSLVEGLLDEGHVVCGVAASVADGVTLARLHRPDIAILDMQLRGRERGSDIADQLAESGDLDHMGILYVTGEAGRGLQQARYGHACLHKPYSFTALNVALEVVRDIVLDGCTSRTLPQGLQILHSTPTPPQPAA